MHHPSGKSIRQLRIAAILEGISYLLLLGLTMPLKYLLDMPEPNKLVGYAHGVLFIWYIALVLVVAYRYRWPLRETFIALAASLFPFATFYVESRMLRKEALISRSVKKV
jgi:integral membrane protein